MAPTTRVDRLVWLRGRAEQDALASVARARAGVERAREGVSRASGAALADGRAAGRVELWLLDDDGHRRALQALRAAEHDVSRALQDQAAALAGYGVARQKAEAVRRVQERRRAESMAEIGRRERRALDEVATLRFNASR